MDDKKLAIITGATGAIGKAVARQILSTGDYHVIMVVRSEEKALRTIKDLKQLTGNDSMSYAVVDLSEKKQIHNLAAQITDPVGLLVNNAAFTPRKRMENSEGIEMQFATNVLGYFWMIEAFAPHLKKRTPSRVVNVASYWAGGLDLSDLEFKRRNYNNDLAYRQSKQANRMLTIAFSDMLSSFGVSVNACHPGDVNSALSNSLGFGGHETPDQGADTPVWLATSNDVEGITGKYFEHRKQVQCEFSRDREKIGELFRICEES